MAMSDVSSYRAGAVMRITTDPMMVVTVNSHKNSRSSTMAMNPQSLSSCDGPEEKKMKLRDGPENWTASPYRVVLVLAPHCDRHTKRNEIDGPLFENNEK